MIDRREASGSGKMRANVGGTRTNTSDSAAVQELQKILASCTLVPDLVLHIEYRSVTAALVQRRHSVMFVGLRTRDIRAAVANHNDQPIPNSQTFSRPY